MTEPRDSPQRTVVLVDDHQLIREGLARAFERDGTLHVMGQSATVADALRLVEQTRPSVVVTDVRLPDGSGIDLVAALRRRSNSIGLVVLTMYSSDDQLFAAMEAGASAFVGKDAPASDVVAAARHALVSPTSFLCAGLAEAMTRRMTAPRVTLSDREDEVLQLLAKGRSIAQISHDLFISQSTTKSHITRLYEKLGAENRSQALMSAIRLKLVDSTSD